MSKIIICSPSKNNIVGGVERFCYLLEDVLINNNFYVEIIGKEDIKNNFLWRIFKNIKGLDLIVLGYLLGKLADNLKPDLVVTNGLYGFSTKIKSINIQHGTFAGASDIMDRNIFKKIIRKYIWGYFEKLAVKKAIKVVAVSKYTKDLIEKYYKRKDIKVILNGVDTNLFSKKNKVESKKIFNLPLDKKLILFVGRLSYQKSPEIIYELVKKFEKDNVFFIFATDRVLNWNFKNTIFLLNVDYQKLPYLYSACDVFILPSKHEGFAFTVIEAMSCELPFVISSVGGYYEILQEIPEFKNFILKDLDILKWYNKIKEILNFKKVQLDKIKKLERDFVINNCSLKIFDRRYVDLIENLKI